MIVNIWYFLCLVLFAQSMKHTYFLLISNFCMLFGLLTGKNRLICNVLQIHLCHINYSFSKVRKRNWLSWLNWFCSRFVILNADINKKKDGNVAERMRLRERRLIWESFMCLGVIQNKNMDCISSCSSSFLKPKTLPTFCFSPFMCPCWPIILCPVWPCTPLGHL